MPSSTISSCCAPTARPTYMLAVVVDDHDMGVTHVIRGDDHLNNAFRQLPIIRGDGLAGAGLCPCPADPRRRRRQALQAPRRARRRGLSRRAGHPARGACSTICCGSAGAMATTRSSAASRRSHGSISTRVGKSPVALRPQEAREPQRPLSARGRRRRGSPRWSRPRLGRRGRCDLLARGHAGAEAARARISTSWPTARPSCSRTVRLTWTRRRPRCSTAGAPDLLGARPCGAGRAWPTGRAEATEQAVREVAEARGVKLGQVAQPLRAALTGRRPRRGSSMCWRCSGARKASRGSPTQVTREGRFERMADKADALASAARAIDYPTC